MASIFIYKEKKSFIRSFLNNLNTFGCLGFSFYFNYKFIGGNDFFEVSDKKIKKIEDILKNE